MEQNNVVERGRVYWANLNPRKGSEQGNLRPVLVVSPDQGNTRSEWGVVTVVPLTTKGVANPLRIEVETAGRRGFALVFQVRTLDKSRLGALVDTLPDKKLGEVLEALRKFFA